MSLRWAIMALLSAWPCISWAQAHAPLNRFDSVCMVSVIPFCWPYAPHPTDPFSLFNTHQSKTLISAHHRPLKNFGGPRRPKIAIIIDDLGAHPAAQELTLKLPKEVAVAILPDSRYGADCAQRSAQQARDILIHAPMQPRNLKKPFDGLTLSMTQVAFQQRLLVMLNQLPQAKGLNNHMGSALTENVEKMRWVMAILKQKNLFFVDSRTSVNTQAQQVAENMAIPTLHRHIFLDNRRDYASIHREFNRLLTLARKNGVAIAIGHPYAETLHYLDGALKQLESQQVTLVKLTDLLNTQ